MSTYPKHIAYRRKRYGKSFHGVARDSDEERTLQSHIRQCDYILVRCEPVAEMDDDE